MKNEKLIKSGLPKFEVNEELNQKVLQQLQEGTEKKNVVSFSKHRNYRKWVAVACSLVLVFGGVIVVDAATGGHIRKSVQNFVTAYVFADGEAVEVKTYQAENGIYVLEEGNAGDISAMKKDGSLDKISDFDEDETGMGFVNKYDEEGKLQASIITSTKDDDIFHFSFQGDSIASSGYTIGIPKKWKNKKKIEYLREWLVENYQNLESKKDKKIYLEELKKIEGKVEQAYVKEGIQKARKDCVSLKK